MSINSVCISGNLGGDPELRTTASGMPILSFSVAVTDRRKNNQTGEWEDYTNWVSCTMFGTRAKNINQYLSKGTHVTIEGKLRFSKWEKDGHKRSKLEVVVDDIDFTSNRNSGSGPQGASTYSAPTTPVVDTTYSVYDEDIPF